MYANFSGTTDSYDWAAIQSPWDDDTWREPDLRDHELRVLADRQQPAFCDRLADLLTEFPTLPLVRSANRLHHWLDALAEDPEPEAAALYFTLRCGFFLLPPGTDHPRFFGSNYGSCAEAETEIDTEISRLLGKNILGTWAAVAAEYHHDLDDLVLIMSLGVVVKRGKTRLVVDASRPEGAGRSLNSAADLPPTRLANIGMAMRAFSPNGLFWAADLEDAFHQTSLAADSTRLAGIRWRGVTYVYRRSFFGFAPAPAMQQAVAVALCRITTRQLRRRGLPCGDPVGWNMCWASADPDMPTCDQRGETAAEQAVGGGPAALNRPPASGYDSVVTILAYLDDFWTSTCGRPEASAFSFLHFLSVCQHLGVRLKTSKMAPPASEGLFLGIHCSLPNMMVSLGADRVIELSGRLRALLAVPTVSIGELMSIVGVLVFCSVVIPAARCFYRRLLDALKADGSRQRRYIRLPWTVGMRTDVTTWLAVLDRYNGRPVSRGVSDPIFRHAGYSDASFSGFGWHLDGTVLFDRDTWPASWTDRIGMHSVHHDIYIVELELWGALFMLRAIIPLAGTRDGRSGGRLRLFNDNQSVCGMLSKLTTTSRRCLPLIKEIVGLLVVYGITLIVSWVDTVSNRHADLLSRFCDPTEHKATLMAELRQLRAAAPRREFRAADRRPAQRPDLADLFPAAVMDEYTSAPLVSEPEAAALQTVGSWSSTPLR